MPRRAPNFWKTRNLTSIALWPLSKLYQLIAYFDRKKKLKVSYRPKVPTIVVGNLTVGGNGKTPLVAMLAQHFKKQGDNVAILSRGYGGTITSAHQVTKTDEAAVVGDEPKMLLDMKIADQIWVGPDRRETAKKAEENGATILILDDGFQHWKLERDVDIVVVDGEYGFGNKFTLPAGPLREPVKNIERATFAVVMNEELDEKLHIPTIIAERGPNPKDLVKVLERDIVVFCGIGLPQQFIGGLRDEGLKVVGTKVFGDHHKYTQEDMQELMRLASDRRAQLVTTAKDLAKLPKEFRKLCHVVHPAIRERDKNKIIKKVEKALGRYNSEKEAV